MRSDELWEGYVRAWKFDPATEAALMRGEGYEAFGQLESYSHAMSHLTISPTVLRAGNAINVLPSVAWMELDIRPLPGQTQEDIDQVLREDKGYTYGIRAGFRPRQVGSAFTVSGSVRADSTVDSLRLLAEILSGVGEGFTDAETRAGQDPAGRDGTEGSAGSAASPEAQPSSGAPGMSQAAA